MSPRIPDITHVLHASSAAGKRPTQRRCAGLSRRCPHPHLSMLPPCRRAHLLLPAVWVHAQHLLDTWLCSIQLDLQLQTEFLRVCVVHEQGIVHSRKTSMTLLTVRLCRTILLY